MQVKFFRLLDVYETVLKGQGKSGVPPGRMNSFGGRPDTGVSGLFPLSLRDTSLYPLQTPKNLGLFGGRGNPWVRKSVADRYGFSLASAAQMNEFPAQNKDRWWWWALLLAVVGGASLRSYLLPAQVLIDDEWHGVYYAIGKSPLWLLTHFSIPGATCIPLNLYTWALAASAGWSGNAVAAAFLDLRHRMYCGGAAAGA